ncbi:hypothetical protein Pint_08325 [Pistacia integerrima]|uniref:Uncharacterized protein n=1 Tax=Pistacia integerrima TaxID=434235 RepID=A0ACC0XYZ1_9ROSI|nr:hypothetical protein Pint_08325 [Pistacia integerrima]
MSITRKIPAKSNSKSRTLFETTLNCFFTAVDSIFESYIPKQASFVFLTSNPVLYNLYANNISTLMNSCIWKTLVFVYFKHSSHLHKPPIACSSLSLFFFSSYSSS